MYLHLTSLILGVAVPVLFGVGLLVRQNRKEAARRRHFYRQRTQS